MATLGDAPLNGVYTLGSHANNYPVVLDLTYPISERDTGEFILNEVEIGSVLVEGDEIFVSWYNHHDGTFGVDKIDYANKLDGAYLETALKAVYRQQNSNFTNMSVAYVDLPTGTDIEMEYSTDYGVTYIPTTETTDTDRMVVSAEEGIESTTLMLKVILTALDDDAPVVDEVIISTS